MRSAVTKHHLLCLVLVAIAALLPAPHACAQAGEASPAPICGPDGPKNTNMFSPATGQTRLIAELTWFVIAVSAVILVIVELLLLGAVLRYRQRKAEAGDPPQCYGSGPIELAWTVVPILIVLALTLVSARAIFDVDVTSPPEGSRVIEVVGHQWWWEFRYPDEGIVTANELVLPVSAPDDPRPVALKLRSADVVHSFWVPRLAGKMDVFPNRQNLIWFDPVVAGTYFGQCAEYCGTQHANMLIRVHVLPHARWEQWVRDQRQAGARDPSVAAGRDAFLSLSCINCHRVAGTIAQGTFAPDLTHLKSRETLAAGVVMNTRENLLAWLRDPDRIKPGCNMPDMNLDPRQLELVVDYLETLE